MDVVVKQLPHTGRLQFDLHVSADVNFSATAARRQVGRFVADGISYLMRGGEPGIVLPGVTTQPLPSDRQIRRLGGSKTPAHS